MDQSLPNDQLTPRSKSSSGFWEVAVIAVLVFLILATLNYFRILPLSDTLPFLSFLPQQSASQRTAKPFAITQTQQKRPPFVQQVIAPSDPKIFTNDTKVNKTFPIKGSGTRVINGLQIDVEMTLKQDKKSTAAAGFMFDNGLKFDDKNLRRLFLFYWPKSNAWVLSYQYGNQKEFTGNLVRIRGAIYGKFSLKISKDGRNVVIVLPNGEERTLALKEPLYGVKNTMSARVSVPPNSGLTISSLSYQY